MQLIPSRISRALIPQLFAQLGGAPDVVVFGYGVHHDKVPPEEQAKLRKLAERIVNSFDTIAPIVAVKIVGHADRELSVPGEAARRKSEQEHSKARAEEVRDLLLKIFKQLRPRAQAALDRTMMNVSAIGAAELLVQNPRNEHDRTRNRRVEIFLGQAMVLPKIPEPPEIFPRDGPDPDNDPNVVFAGDQFRIKMLSATSFGEIAGLTTIAFLIWDFKNSRAAEYEYTNVILTAGSPLTFTGEGAFSDPFTTPKFIQVDQFGGSAGHASAGIGSLGIMVLSFLNNPFLGLKPFSVNVPTGSSKGFGGETGKAGPFKLVSGSVRVFRGP